MIRVADVDIGRDRRANARVATQLADDRAERGTIALQEAGVQFGRGVPFLLELHVADNRELVGNLGLHRQQFANLHPRHIGLNGIELAPIIDRRFGLQVVHVHMAGTTVQVDHDDGFVSNAGRRILLRPQTQQIGQREAAHAKSARSEKAAAIEIVAVAGGIGAEESEHSVLQTQNQLLFNSRRYHFNPDNLS